VIDLHLHTSASDGQLSPSDLIARVAAAGITVCAVTDHDTVGGLAEAAEAAGASGLRLLPGIEITAVDGGRDVHMLGYGFDPGSGLLDGFLRSQREERRRRVGRILERLAALGMPLDEGRILAARAAAGGGTASSRTLGRPHVARAMIEAGYVADVGEAFDLWLASGRPAFVPRGGASPADVVALIHRAGGVASMAHPGQTKRDDLIDGLVAAGLDAIEVWHGEHDDAATARYAALATARGLLMTGGSDFHGEMAGRVSRLGEVVVPREALDALLARMAHARASV
jgi:predicted metal-dependent phosphoesterase TrpH